MGVARVATDAMGITVHTAVVMSARIATMEIAAETGAGIVTRDTPVIATDGNGMPVAEDIAGIMRLDAAAGSAVGASAATKAEVGSDSLVAMVMVVADLAGIAQERANSTLDTGMAVRGTSVADVVTSHTVASCMDIKLGSGLDSVMG